METKRVKRRRNGAKRGLAITLTVFAAVYVFLVVFLSVMLNAESLGVGRGSLNGEYGSVMADIERVTEANPRIVDMAMLGSHDAVTDKMSLDSPMDYHDRDTVLGKIDKITDGFQYRFGVTQTVGLYEQMMQGSRFLHIKYTDYDGVWYGTHAHITGKIEDYMREVLRFVGENPGEFVILLFQPMYFADKTYTDFHNWLATVKLDGKSIYDYVRYEKADTFASGDENLTSIGELRYNDVTQNGTGAGIILLDRREEGNYEPRFDEGYGTGEFDDKFFDMDSNAVHTWHSRSCSKTLIKKIGETADSIESDMQSYEGKLRVNQTQAAFSGASFNDIMCDIFGWSLLKITQKHNVRLLENKDFGRWLDIMPIFQVDFVNSDYGDFNARANEAISRYNAKLCECILAEAASDNVG